MKRTLQRSLALFLIGLIYFTSPLTLSANPTPGKAVNVRQIFPRGQGYESRIINVLGAQFGIDVNSDLGRIFSRLGLLAAEVYYSNDNVITADKVIYEVGNPDGRVKAGVWGLLAVLVMNEAKKNETNKEAVGLRDWSTKLFRSMKVRLAKGVLNEYQRWNADYCRYRADGYKAPAGCGLGNLDQMQNFSRPSPPEDVIAKAGLKSLFPNEADNIAKLIAIGSTVVTVGGAAMALSTVLSTALSTTITTGISKTITIGTAFAGAAGGQAAVAWASAAAPPLAAAVLIIVVGTTEGIRVVEATKVEPMLKLKLGQAMTEHISLPNVFSEVSGRDMFFMAFMEAANKGFKLTPPNVNGELRFYCQAGYVSKFSVTYTADFDKTGFKPDVRTETKTTQNLTVGNQELIETPYNAKNIYVKGEYWDGKWIEFLNQYMNAPTFMCYTSYGTVFNPNYKTDCPEVGNMIAKRNELTVTQGGAYAAWVYLSYKQNGKVVIIHDQQGLTMGWRKVYQIPEDATQIYLYIREATGLTGLLGDPWKAVVEKVWPVPPNECIKIYGTTLDPKWNNECN